MLSTLRTSSSSGRRCPDNRDRTARSKLNPTANVINPIFIERALADLAFCHPQSGLEDLFTQRVLNKLAGSLAAGSAVVLIADMIREKKFSYTRSIAAFMSLLSSAIDFYAAYLPNKPPVDFDIATIATALASAVEDAVDDVGKPFVHPNLDHVSDEHIDSVSRNTSSTTTPTGSIESNLNVDVSESIKRVQAHFAAISSLNTAEEQSNDLIISIASCVAIVFFTAALSFGISSSKFLEKIPSGFNLFRTVITNGKSTFATTKNMIATTFFGEPDANDATNTAVLNMTGCLTKLSNTSPTELAIKPTFLSEFRKQLESAKALLVKLNKSDSLHQLLINSIVSSETKYEQFKRILDAVGVKQIPTMFIFGGPGGIGKTTSRDALARRISPIEAYTVNASSANYFPVYIGSPVMSVQELGACNDPKGDIITRSLTAIASPEAFNLEGAFEKSQPFRSVTVLMDTNRDFPDLLSGFGLNQTSLEPLCQRIRFIECVWMLDQKYMAPPYTRETRPYMPDHSHIGFYLKERSPTGEFYRADWFRYVYPGDWEIALANFDTIPPVKLDACDDLNTPKTLLHGMPFLERIKKPMTLDEIEIFERYYRTLNHKFYLSRFNEVLKSLEAAETLQQAQLQADEKISLVMYGKPGQGKTYILERLLSQFIATPCTDIHRFNASESPKLPKINDKHLNVYVFDDFIPLKASKARLERERFFMDVYNAAPNHSIFLTATNDIPEVSHYVRRLNLNRTFLYSKDAIYKTLYNQDGVHRRVGFNHDFVGLDVVPNKHCYYVESRSAVHNNEIYTLEQIQERLFDDISRRYKVSSDLVRDDSFAIPPTADIIVTAPSMHALSRSLTGFGLARLLSGTSDCTLSFAPGVRDEFIGVSTRTFAPPTSSDFPSIARHFASLARSVGCDRTMLAKVGDDVAYVHGNTLTLNTTKHEECVNLMNGNLQFGDETIPLVTICELVVFPSSVSYSEIGSISVPTLCAFKNFVVNNANRNLEIAATFEYVESKRRRAMPGIALAKMLAFVSEHKLEFLFGATITGVVAAAIALVPRASDTTVVEKLRLKAAEGKEVLSEFTSLTAKQRSLYVRRFGHPILGHRNPRIVFPQSFIDDVGCDPSSLPITSPEELRDLVLQDQTPFKRRAIRMGNRFFVKRANGSWREYNEDGVYVADGTFHNGKFRAHAWQDDVDQFNGKRTQKLRKRKLNLNDFEIDVRDYKEEDEEIYFQSLAQIYATDDSTVNHFNKISENLVNVSCGTARCYGLAVCSNFVLIPRHIKKEYPIIISFKRNDMLYTSPASTFVEFGARDLYLVAIDDKRIPQFPDITSKFVNHCQDIYGYQTVLFVPRGDSFLGLCGTVAVTRGDYAAPATTVMGGQFHDIVCSELASPNDHTRDGDCGLPYFLKDNITHGEPSILGLHSLGTPSSPYTWATCITQAELMNGIKHMRNQVHLNSLTTVVPQATVDTATGEQPLNLTIKNEVVATRNIHARPASICPIPGLNHSENVCVCTADGLLHNPRPSFESANTYFSYEIPPELFPITCEELSNLDEGVPPMMDFEHISVIGTTTLVPVNNHTKDTYCKTPHYSIAKHVFGPPQKAPVHKLHNFTKEDISKLPLNNCGLPDQMYYNAKLADEEIIDVPSRVITVAGDLLARYLRPTAGRYLVMAPKDTDLSGLSFDNCRRYPELMHKLQGLELGASSGPFASFLLNAPEKKNLISLYDAKRVWRPTYAARCMAALIDVNLERAKQRKPLISLFKTSLKDELLPLEKTWKGRNFEIGGLETIAVERQVFGLFLGFNHGLNTTIPCRVGMNPLADWHEFEMYHRRHPNHWTGDFSRWDKRVHPALYKIFARALDQSSDDQEWKNAAFSVLRNLCYSKRLTKNVLLQYERGMPSGTALTAVINSWLIFCLMLAVWILQTNITDMAIFLEHVHISSYGDDLRVSVSDEFKDQFSLIHVSEVCLRVFGIVLDSDKKDGELNHYSDPSECGFLSRHPRKIGDYFVGALKKESIVAPFYWTNSLRSPRQNHELFVNAYLESVVWGRDFADQVYSFINKAMTADKSLAAEFSLKPLPTFESMQTYIRNLIVARKHKHSSLIEPPANTSEIRDKILEIKFDTQSLELTTPQLSSSEMESMTRITNDLVFRLFNQPEYRHELIYKLENGQFSAQSPKHSFVGTGTTKKNAKLDLLNQMYAAGELLRVHKPVEVVPPKQKSASHSYVSANHDEIHRLYNHPSRRYPISYKQYGKLYVAWCPTIKTDCVGAGTSKSGAKEALLDYLFNGVKEYTFDCSDIDMNELDVVASKASPITPAIPALMDVVLPPIVKPSPSTNFRTRRFKKVVNTSTDLPCVFRERVLPPTTLELPETAFGPFVPDDFDDSTPLPPLPLSDDAPPEGTMWINLPSIVGGGRVAVPITDEREEKLRRILSISFDAQMMQMNNQQTSDSPHMAGAGTGEGKLTMMNDGMPEIHGTAIPSTAMLVDTLVDSQYNAPSTSYFQPLPLVQAPPVIFDHDAWSLFWGGSHEFGGGTLNGTEARGYVILHISTDPNSPFFPIDVGGPLTFIRNFMRGHKYFVDHNIVKCAIASATGMVGRVITARIPTGYVFAGDTPTPQELTSSGFDYEVTTLNGDQNICYDLKPIVNTGFATATSNTEQVVSHMDLFVLLDVTPSTTYSENPPQITYKFYLSKGEGFRATTPKQNLLSMFTGVGNGGTITTIARPVLPTNLFYAFRSNLAVGSRNFRLTPSLDGAITGSRLPIELFGGQGRAISGGDLVIPYVARPFNTGDPDGSIYKVATHFAFGDIPPIATSANNLDFREIFIAERINNFYPESYQFEGNDPNIVAALNDPNNSYAIHAEIDELDDIDFDGYRVLVGRDAYRCAVFIIPMKGGVQKNGFSFFFRQGASVITAFGDNDPVVDLGERKGIVPVGSIDVVNLKNGDFLATASLPSGVGDLISVVPPALNFPAPNGISSTNLYAALTLTTASPNFLSDIGSGAIPNEEHRVLYEYLYERLGTASGLEFEIVNTAGVTLANVKFDPFSGLLVNASQEFSYYQNGGLLYCSNLRSTSATLPPTNNDNWVSTRYIPNRYRVLPNVDKALESLRIVTPQAFLGSILGGAASGIGNALQHQSDIKNTNEQNALDRDLARYGYENQNNIAFGGYANNTLTTGMNNDTSKYIASGGWENQLALSKQGFQQNAALSQQSAEQKLTSAGILNPSRMLSGQNPGLKTSLTAQAAVAKSAKTPPSTASRQPSGGNPPSYSAATGIKPNSGVTRGTTTQRSAPGMNTLYSNQDNLERSVSNNSRSEGPRQNNGAMMTGPIHQQRQGPKLVTTPPRQPSSSGRKGPMYTRML